LVNNFASSYVFSISSHLTSMLPVDAVFSPSSPVSDSESGARVGTFLS